MVIYAYNANKAINYIEDIEQYNSQQLFNSLTWISDYYDGDVISFNVDKLKAKLNEVLKEVNNE